MSDRLKSLRIVDPVLTTLARGYRNAQFVGEVLFPVAEIEKESGTIPLFGKEAFQLWETERAIRARSNVMDTDDADKLDVVLHEHDLARAIDTREEAESMFNEQSQAALVVKDAVDLRREATCARLAQSVSTYDSGNKIALSGSSQWNAGGGDPQAVVEAGKEVIRQRTGIRPNTAIIGAEAYASLKFHPKLGLALGAQERKLITIEHLKALFGLEDIVIGEAIAANASGATGDLWGDNVVLAYVKKPQAGLATDHKVPSFGYTLRKKGMPETDTYPDQGGKITWVRHTDTYRVIVLGRDAGYLISNVNA